MNQPVNPAHVTHLWMNCGWRPKGLGQTDDQAVHASLMTKLMTNCWQALLRCSEWHGVAPKKTCSAACRPYLLALVSFCLQQHTRTPLATYRRPSTSSSSSVARA
jgi:hypothetical protein